VNPSSQGSTKLPQVEGISKSALVRLAIEKELERSREDELTKGSETLAPLYKTDKELTAFSALDGEDWYE